MSSATVRAAPRFGSSYPHYAALHKRLRDVSISGGQDQVSFSPVTPRTVNGEKTVELDRVDASLISSFSADRARKRGSFTCSSSERHKSLRMSRLEAF